MEALGYSLPLGPDLAERARKFGERRPEIRRWVEERDRLRCHVDEDRRRWEELNHEVGAYYAT